MYRLVIEFDNGCIEEHFFETKEEVENEVDFQWTEEADFSIGCTGFPFLIFWEDRYEFGW